MQPVAPAPDEDESFTDMVRRFIGRFNGESAAEDGEQAPVKEWDAYDVANQAFDAMQSTISRQKLAAYPPDVTVEIARNACGTLEFDRADEMIELGRSKAEALLKG